MLPGSMSAPPAGTRTANEGTATRAPKKSARVKLSPGGADLQMLSQACEKPPVHQTGRKRQGGPGDSEAGTELRTLQGGH